MSYINIKEEWKLFWGWLILVVLLLSSECTSSPSGAIVLPYKEKSIYSITEPLGTIHRYRTKPIIIDDKRLELYCIVHACPEIIIKLRTGEWRVRQWKR